MLVAASANSRTNDETAAERALERIKVHDVT